jgi:hypothetical protein
MIFPFTAQLVAALRTGKADVLGALPPQLKSAVGFLDSKDRDEAAAEEKTRDPLETAILRNHGGDQRLRAQEPLRVTTAMRLSQKVPPADVDRFGVRFTHELRMEKGMCEWAEDFPERAVVTYDGGKVVISSRFNLPF